jgi:hypothetical protein
MIFCTEEEGETLKKGKKKVLFRENSNNNKD